MRYIIYGAGGIGGTLGARLHLAGSEVILIARGAHLQAIQTEGLTLKDPHGVHRLDIQSVGHPSQINWRSDDVVILTMKGQDTPGALTDLLHGGAAHCPVVCCQTGVANEALALRRFNSVYGMVVYVPSTHLTAGEVLHHTLDCGGVLEAGCYPLGTEQLIEQVCADVTAAGFSSRPDATVMRWKYAKLLMNLGNALQAAIGIDTSTAGTVSTQLREEALASYAAAGIDCASAAEVKHRHAGSVQMGSIENHERGGGSSWQSLLRGTGSIEADYLNGEISYLGRLHGVPVPANATLQRVANTLARERAEPGRYNVAELQKLIDAEAVA